MVVVIELSLGVGVDLVDQIEQPVPARAVPGGFGA